MVSAFDDEDRQSTSVFSQADGSFRIENLHEATFRIRARLPGQRDQWIERVELGDGDVRITMEPATGKELEAQRPASDAFGQLKFESPRDRLNFKMMCSYCHQIGTTGFRTPEKPVDWETMIRRMDGFGGLYPHTKETIVQRIIDTYKDDAIDRWPAYVPPPAPSGMVTKAKITAWEMGEPYKGSFHDLEFGDDGLAYVVHIGKQYTATLDPETGERIYYRLPRGSHGPHSIEPDNDGEMWLTLCVSGEMAKFDLKTKEYTILSSAEPPAERGSWPHTLRINPKDPEGYIWYTDAGRNSVFRLHPKTLERKEYHLLEAGQVKAGGKGESKGITPYGLDYSPVDGMIWYSKLNGNRIGRIDPKAPDGDITEWNPPFRGPRRLHVAPDGMVWVPGFGSGVFSKFDPNTEKWTTYPLPDYLNQIPYALNVAPDGMVWICGTGNDTLYRFNPKTEYLVEFPLPFRVSYTREIEFDQEGNVWTSTSGPARHMENACGTVIRLELPDDLEEETGGMKLSPIKLSLAEQGIASDEDRAKLAKTRKAGQDATQLIQSGKFDSSPFDAVDFALKVKNLDERRSALSAAFGRLGGGVGGVKVEAVEERIHSMRNSANRDFAINGFAHGLVAKNPGKALKWANSIKDEGFRKIVVRNVSRRIKSQPPNTRKPPEESMEEQTGIHRLDTPKRAPFDAFVYVNRIPDKARDGESSRDFAGRIHGRLANQEGRIQLKLPPGMALAAYKGFKSFLGSEGNPSISNCMACHSGPEFSAGKNSLRNLKKTDAELQSIIRGKMAKAASGENAYAGLKITEAEVAGLVSFLQSLTDVSDKRFRDLVLEAKVTDVTKEPKPAFGAKTVPSLKGTIRFDGPRPKRPPVPMDESSRKLHKSQPLDESILVGQSGGLANVFVYVKDPPPGEYKPPGKPAILDQKGSIFTPRVQGVRVGQELLMKNGDPFIHNVRSLSRKNRQFNIAQPQGTPDRKKIFDQSEGPITLKCDFHRWMEAHLWVMDHPFFAVSDAEGKFWIPDLPPGDYELIAWHEKLGEQSQKITVRKSGSTFSFQFRALPE
jgi:streptogramin lyase/mono/diheme cytochrome c family protein